MCVESENEHIRRIAVAVHIEAVGTVS
jgi:hypothetical protein